MDSVKGSKGLDVGLGGSWIQAQRKIFTRWCNAYLRHRLLHIDDLSTDFKDGILIINLLEILSGETMRRKWNRTPKFEIHMKENLGFAFQWMKDMKVPLVNIGSHDLYDGNEKIILGLIWALISHFQLGTVSVDGISGKEGLKLWCERKITPYGITVKNFTKDWKSGLAFAALLHSTWDQCIDYHGLDKENHAECLQTAFDVAENVFEVPKMLDVEDLLDVARPDEKIILTYVSFFFKGFARYLKEQSCVKAITKAMDITRRHEKWVNDLTEESKSLNGWLDQTMDAFSVRTEGAEGHGDCVTAIKETISNFYAYKKQTLPEMRGRLSALEGLLNTLRTSQRNNNRPVIGTTEDIDVPALHGRWEQLVAEEDAYEQSVLASFSHFQRLEMNIGRFNIKADRLDHWLTAQNELFVEKNFGGSSVEVDQLLESHKTYEQQIKVYEQIPDQLSEICVTDNMELHATYPEMYDRLQSLNELLETTKANGNVFAELLKDAQKEWKKMMDALKVEAWLEGQAQVFAGTDRGSSLVTVQLLIATHQEFRKQFATKKEQINAMEANDAVSSVGLEEKLVEINSKIIEVEDAANTYLSECESSEETFKKVAEMVRDFNSKATGFLLNADDLEEELLTPIIGESVDAINGLVAELESQTRPKMERITDMYLDIDKIARDLMDSETEEAKTAFNRYTLHDLYNRHQALEKYIEERETQLQQRVGEEALKEQKRVEFAGKADEMHEYCNRKTKEVGALQGSIEEQLVALKELKKEFGAGKDMLEELHSMSEEMIELGVVTNSHTPHTVFGLKAMNLALEKVYVQAEEGLQSSLMAEGGITAEQYKEIREVFEYFDSDSSGSMNQEEFWSCTTGIGLVFSEKEIGDIFAKLDLSGDGMIDFDEFTVWMKEQLSEPGHTKEDIIEAFKELTKPHHMSPVLETISEPRLDYVFHNTTDCAYIKKNSEEAPEQQSGKEFTYVGFAAHVFSM